MSAFGLQFLFVLILVLTVSAQHLVGAPAVMHKVLDLGGVSLLAERGAFLRCSPERPTGFIIFLTLLHLVLAAWRNHDVCISIVYYLSL